MLKVMGESWFEWPHSLNRSLFCPLEWNFKRLGFHPLSWWICFEQSEQAKISTGCGKPVQSWTVSPEGELYKGLTPHKCLWEVYMAPSRRKSLLLQGRYGPLGSILSLKTSSSTLPVENCCIRLTWSSAGLSLVLQGFRGPSEASEPLQNWPPFIPRGGGILTVTTLIIWSWVEVRFHGEHPSLFEFLHVGLLDLTARSDDLDFSTLANLKT